MTFSFETLEVYEESKKLVVLVYKLVSNFPQHETYNLVDQARRSITSVPLNISEGTARMYNKDCSRFISISLGSLSEAVSCLDIAVSLGYITKDQYKEVHTLADGLGKRLYKLRQVKLKQC